MALILSDYVLIFDGSLRRSDAGDGNAEGRAAYVVHAEFGAELDARGFAAVFAADADLEVGTGCAAFFYAHADELTDAFLVEDFEGVDFDDAVFLVEFEEFGCVVA